MNLIDGALPFSPPILKVNGIEPINLKYSLLIINVIVRSLPHMVLLFIASFPENLREGKCKRKKIERKRRKEKKNEACI